MISRPVRQVSKATTKAATVRGINSYDSLVAMPEGFAITLRNLFAQPQGCQVRRGYYRHATGMTGTVESIGSHNKLSKELYAWTTSGNAGMLYDITTPDQDGTMVFDDLTNGRWQHVNVSNVAGVHMVAVNGADPLIWFKPDGTIVKVVAGDGTGNTINGVDPTDLIHVYIYQKRLWFVEKDTTVCWYLPPDQIAGEASYFDPGPLFTRGGYVTQIITWTLDDGDGADDHICFISSEGQVAVYSGVDPAAVDGSFALRGVYYCGAPVGRRAATRYGGDILIITQFGLISMSDLLKSTKVNPAEENMSKYIQYRLSLAVTATGKKFGWQTFVYPGSNMIILNAPSSDTNRYQLVMNDITKAWSEFIGYDASCWELHDEEPFFGNLGAVYKAWSGFTDDQYLDPDTNKVVQGADIRSEVQTAFSYFQDFGIQKHFKMVRPTVLSKGQFSLALSVNTDFVFDTPVTSTAFAFAAPGVWDEDYWDNATWSGGLQTFKAWNAVTGIGTAAALRMIMRSNSETYWAAVDWLVESGGVM